MVNSLSRYAQGSAGLLSQEANLAKACWPGFSSVISGALLGAYAVQSIGRDFYWEQYDLLSIGGGATAIVVASVAIRNGLGRIRGDFRAASYLIDQRKKIEGLNLLLRQESGSENKEGILALFTANDHNRALAIDDRMRCNMQRLGKKYHVHCVLIESPKDFERAVHQLTLDGKKVTHLVIAAHGNPDGVELAKRAIHEYLYELPDLERCLFSACDAGSPDSEAPKIGRLYPNITIYAPFSSVDKQLGFYYLDHENKPALIQFSLHAREILTWVFNGKVRTEVPFVKDFAALFAIAEKDEGLRESLEIFLRTLLDREQEGDIAAKQLIESIKTYLPEKFKG